MVYWDYDLQHVQWWNYTTGEKTVEVFNDLCQLKKKEVVCASVTSDGSPGIKRAVDIIYPQVPHQRCLVHLQRSSLSLITRNPRTQAGKEIKPLIQWLYSVDNHQLKKKWIEEFQNWYFKWNNFLKERSYSDDRRNWWYTHGSLRRVRALVKNALSDLFHYLDDLAIPKTSNGLEGRFSSFKQHYRQHRGLSKKRRKGYIAWYLRIVVNNKLPTRSVN